MKAVVVCIPLFLMLTFGSDASTAAGTDNQVKLLMRRYEQVEDQLARSVHYVRKTESDGGTTIEQAWFNGAHDLIKVAVERTGSSGRELTDYVAPTFLATSPCSFWCARKRRYLMAVPKWMNRGSTSTKMQFLFAS